MMRNEIGHWKPFLNGIFFWGGGIFFLEKWLVNKYIKYTCSIHHKITTGNGFWGPMDPRAPTGGKYLGHASGICKKLKSLQGCMLLHTERHFEAANGRITGLVQADYKNSKHVLPNPCYNANASRQYPVPLPCTPRCINAVCFGEHMFNSRCSD